MSEQKSSFESQRIKEELPRFVQTSHEIVSPGEPKEDWDKTTWWFDLQRELKKEKQTEGYKHIAMQVPEGKDPNDYVRYDKLFLLFTDQAEYYCVCSFCKTVYGHMQWSGNTRSRTWRELSEAKLTRHTASKGWCEFCDPIFGNGGWRL